MIIPRPAPAVQAECAARRPRVSVSSECHDMITLDCRGAPDQAAVAGDTLSAPGDGRAAIRVHNYPSPAPTETNRHSPAVAHGKVVYMYRLTRYVQMTPKRTERLTCSRLITFCSWSHESRLSAPMPEAVLTCWSTTRGSRGARRTEGCSAQGELTWEAIRAIFETNVFGVVRVTHAFLPLLLRSAAPVIVNVSSGLGSMARMTTPGSPAAAYPGVAHPASKAAVNMLTIQYAKAFPQMRVNAVELGYTATGLNMFQGTQTVEQGAEIIVRTARSALSQSSSQRGDGAVAPHLRFLVEPPQPLQLRVGFRCGHEPLGGAELAGLDLGHGGGVARDHRAQVGQRHAGRLAGPPHLGAEEVQRRGARVEIAFGGHAGLLLAGACRARSGFANG